MAVADCMSSSNAAFKWSLRLPGAILLLFLVFRQYRFLWQLSSSDYYYEPVVVYDTPAVADKRKQQDDVVHHSYFLVGSNSSVVVPRRLIGLDEGAPRATYSKTYNTLPSLPPEYGLLAAPPRPLAVYNPTILPIPANYDLAKLFLSDDQTKPVYFASFRVSSTTSCMQQWQRDLLIGDDRSPTNYVGLALLDKDLGIIVDVIINFNPQVRNGKKKPGLEDARLFLLNETIYLSHAVLLVPIEISTTTKKKTDGNISNNNNNNSDTAGGTSSSYTFQNLYGDGLVVSTPKGMNRRYLLDIPRGKNFNFFQSSNGSTWLELQPMDPRSTHKVEFESSSPATNNNSREEDSSIYVKPVTDSEEQIKPSFTNDLGNAFRMTRDRGTACCIRLERGDFQDLIPPSHEKFKELHHQDHEYVLVGISHSRSSQRVKEMNGYAYLSRLYAFSPNHPFDLLARSDKFCFGFGDADADDGAYMNITSVPLRIKDNVYSCPRVHFASGMTEKVDDPSKVIVSYGINDCASRMIEIEKREFARHLFTSLVQQPS